MRLQKSSERKKIELNDSFGFDEQRKFFPSKRDEFACRPGSHDLNIQPAERETVSMSMRDGYRAAFDLVIESTHDTLGAPLGPDPGNDLIESLEAKLKCSSG